MRWFLWACVCLLFTRLFKSARYIYVCHFLTEMSFASVDISTSIFFDKYIIQRGRARLRQWLVAWSAPVYKQEQWPKVTWALSYYSSGAVARIRTNDSAAFTLPLAKVVATASCRSSKTGPCHGIKIRKFNFNEWCHVMLLQNLCP